jgi:glyoxylase-like metal-dependent hydrolase (beta-lactamase superfamily II)
MEQLSRRDFLSRSGSCAAHIALAASLSPRLLRDAWARAPLGPVVAREPFGNLERVAEGIWALISTPLGGDRTTLSNGGIVAGRSAVLAIEGFNQPQGALWLATKARELAGRWPTHVAITHYHADHANGVAGYLAPGEVHPSLRATERTRALVLERNQPSDAARAAALAEAVLLSPTQPTSLDLGGRTVRIIPRAGHTESDVSVEIDDPSVVFAGDLFWNAMFPNYVDAIPTRLSASVRALRRSRLTTYVPGHGALGRDADYDRYISMIDDVEVHARAAHARGITAAAAAASYAIPASLGEWTLFNKAFFERAFTAWNRELAGSG